MAVLDSLPSLSIISDFKGQVDFYLWKGIPCARKWPVFTPRTPTPEEAANQALFATVNRAWATMSPAVKQMWKDMAARSSFTGRDLSVSAYYGKLYA